MNDYIAAILLGLVQGFTEFLPISSTGHLIIASHLMGLADERMKLFEVVIQFGSILAVVVLYWPRFWGLLFPQAGTQFSGIRGLYLLFLTTLPASLLGLVAHDFITTYLFSVQSVAFSLIAGALFILFVEKRNAVPKYTTVDQVTPMLALGIGCFQCLSLWSGFSRSASTIMGAMFLGARRELAAEYSFMAAVPIMVAATGYSLLKSFSTLQASDIPFFAVGTVVSFLAALVAIKVLIRLVSHISFLPFAWYRLALAAAILLFI